jgi:hypothetical protein
MKLIIFLIVLSVATQQKMISLDLALEGSKHIQNDSIAIFKITIWKFPSQHITSY